MPDIIFVSASNQVNSLDDVEIGLHSREYRMRISTGFGNLTFMFILAWRMFNLVFSRYTKTDLQRYAHILFFWGSVECSGF